MKNTLMMSVLFLTSVSGANAAIETEHVSLKRSEAASLKILQLFSQEESLKSRLGDSIIDLNEISLGQCSVEVVRPLDTADEAVRDAGNAIQCAVEMKSGEKTDVKIDLSDLAISRWGSRAEKSVSIDAQIAANLFDAIRHQKSLAPADPMFWEMERLCGPDGRVCTEIVAINQEPTELSTGALICNKDFVLDRATNEYKLDRAACVVVDDDPVGIEDDSVGEPKEGAEPSEEDSESSD
jgi:hypothetical protein